MSKLPTPVEVIHVHARSVTVAIADAKTGESIGDPKRYIEVILCTNVEGLGALGLFSEN